MCPLSGGAPVFALARISLPPRPPIEATQNSSTPYLVLCSVNNSLACKLIDKYLRSSVNYLLILREGVFPQHGGVGDTPYGVVRLRIRPNYENTLL
jgi:hypothetical protein